MYQKCPICDGRGISGFNSNYDKTTCPTCNGKRIISTLTGLPPRTPVMKIEVAQIQGNGACFGGNKLYDLTLSQGHQLEYD